MDKSKVCLFSRHKHTFTSHLNRRGFFQLYNYTDELLVCLWRNSTKTRWTISVDWWTIQPSSTLGYALNFNIMTKNRLIAGFMGIAPKIATPDKYILKVGLCELSGSMDYCLALIDSLQYDKSLDLLFEVVDKIESLGYRTELYSGSMILFRIGKPSERRYFLEYSCNTKIETIYNACVGFIEWYNKQQK